MEMAIKKRTKKYQPKRIVKDAAFRVIRLSKPVQEDSKTMLNEQIHSALLAITKGVGEPAHFDVLASTVDIVFMMTMNLFNDAYKEDIQKAREAMFRLKDRFHKHGVFSFDGEGYQAIKQLIIIHNEILNNVTGAEVLQFMKARQNAIAGGNYYRGEDEKKAA